MTIRSFKLVEPCTHCGKGIYKSNLHFRSSFRKPRIFVFSFETVTCQLNYFENGRGHCITYFIADALFCSQLTTKNGGGHCFNSCPPLKIPSTIFVLHLTGSSLTRSLPKVCRKACCYVGDKIAYKSVSSALFHAHSTLANSRLMPSSQNSLTYRSVTFGWTFPKTVSP